MKQQLKNSLLCDIHKKFAELYFYYVIGLRSYIILEL